MHPSQFLTWLCLGLLTGSAAGEWATPTVGFAVGFVGLSMACVTALPRSMRLAAVCVLGLGLGIVRFHTAAETFPATHLVHRVGHVVTFTGIVAAESDIRTHDQRLTVTAEPPDRGRVLVVTSRYPVRSYGDRVTVRCTLEAPEPVEDFRYDRYLARSDIFVLCRRATTDVIGRAGSPVLRVLFAVKTRFLAGLQRTLVEPHASLASGLLVGARQSIPDHVREDFSRTGTTHIIALSGYNITIIATVVLRAAVSLGLRRQRAYWVTLTLIGLFVALAGAGPSIVRAGIMGCLVLTAQQLGRLSRIGITLLASATVMVMLQPLILLWDVGFQLSFLATLGLVYLSPHLTRWTRWLPERLGIRESFTATVSATVLTLPLTLAQFQRLPVLAPLVNVLVLAAIPLAMGLGFLIGLVALISLPVALVMSWLPTVVLGYVLQTTAFFSSLPIASTDVPPMPLGALVGFYGVLVCALFAANRRQTASRDVSPPAPA